MFRRANAARMESISARASVRAVAIASMRTSEEDRVALRQVSLEDDPAVGVLAPPGDPNRPLPGAAHGQGALASPNLGTNTGVECAEVGRGPVADVGRKVWPRRARPSRALWGRATASGPGLSPPSSSSGKSVAAQASVRTPVELNTGSRGAAVAGVAVEAAASADHHGADMTNLDCRNWTLWIASLRFVA